MKKTLFVALMITIGLIACGKSQPVVNAPTAVTVKAPKPNWVYGGNTDKMDGKVTKYAYTDSTNSVSMKFPYQGGTKATIVVFNDKNVKIMLGKGQIQCSSGCVLRVKFDDNKPETVYANESSDYDSKVIWLNRFEYDDSAIRFIKKLKASKKVMIEINVYQEGSPVWEFNVAGFNGVAQIQQ